MLPVPGPIGVPRQPSVPQQAGSRMRLRVALVASSDSSVRERLRNSLAGLRWQVLEAPGGAEAWMAAQNATQLEALLIDPWLPDLDVTEFLRDFHRENPHVDLMMTDGVPAADSPRSIYHQELLYALRKSYDGDTVPWQAVPVIESPLDTPRQRNVSSEIPERPATSEYESAQPGDKQEDEVAAPVLSKAENSLVESSLAGPEPSSTASRRETPAVERVPELIGSAQVMLEVSRRIRLVAGRSTPVLIEGPTGSGKELVAEALHRLSTRSRKPFVAINCAAIPEALLEAELFGHTRGAFTGAVQGRTGRIEAADGGTIFLDEIGEIPLALQSKLLRFFESGELQRIGDNEAIRVDVRIVAATHQPLAENAQKGHFRADLYYRLAVFLIRTPALAEHMQDLPDLVAHFLEKMGRKAPVKRVSSSAMTTLSGHVWPGNVRELEHVLERAAILSGDEPVITAAEIDFGLSPVN